MRIFHISRWAGICASLGLLIGTCAFGQVKRVAHTGPRALAVITGPAAGKDFRSSRLYPITIFEHGEYHDATLYESNPEPMALEPGTVYEVQHTGEALGLFTVTTPQQLKDTWLATGSWRSQADIEAAAARKAAQSRSSRRRGGTSRSSPNVDSDRPVLRRSSPEESTQSAASDDSSSHPTSQTPAAAPVVAPPADNDPNRPTLSRGRPANASSREETPASLATVKPSSASAITASGAPAAIQPAPNLLVAVSDAAFSDLHSYKFPWTPDEQTRFTKQLRDTAAQELLKYTKSHQLDATAGDWESAEIRAFDLYYDNDAEILFSATRRAQPAAARGIKRPAKAASAPALTIYATLVVLVNSSGEMRLLMSEFTDDQHLDVAGRLQLIDAVDADGDGRGELLFRRIGQHAERYQLYRVTKDSLYKLFESLPSEM